MFSEGSDTLLFFFEPARLFPPVLSFSFASALAVVSLMPAVILLSLSLGRKFAGIVDELDDRHLGIITYSPPKLNYPGITAVAIFVACT